MKYSAVVAIAASLAAQQSKFDVRSRLVQIPTTVTDARGRSIDGLSAADFVVLDNGRRQQATLDTIDTGVAPIALIVAVQSSGISAPVLEKTRRIGSMIQPMVTGDRGCAGLVSFAQRVNWLSECTQDADALGRAFSELRAAEHKEAHMHDAVQAALERLQKMPNSRRVLLLISESRDRGSEATLEAVTVATQTAGVTVYTATYSAFQTAFTSKLPVSRPDPSNKPKTPIEDAQNTMGSANGLPPGRYNPRVPPPEQRVDILAGITEIAHVSRENSAEVMAKATGGTLFPFLRQKALEEAIAKLGDELHAQYVLSFAPDSPAPGYHAVQVHLARPGDFRVRARPGYWPQEPPQ